MQNPIWGVPASRTKLWWRAAADPVRLSRHKILRVERRMIHVGRHVDLGAGRVLGHHHVGLMAAHDLGPLAQRPLVDALVLADHLPSVVDPDPYGFASFW